VALEEVFANADTVLRKTLFLESDEVERLQKMSKSKLDSRITTYYIGLKDGEELGIAFFEASIVRTKKAIILVVISPEKTIKHLEVLAFFEPKEYLPSSKWFELFGNKLLTTNLWPGKDIHAVTGATLSVQAFTLCVRRALATYQLLAEKKE
jgi:Na+-translocating ferredoxin:NAD+ oxidoreductase RnfG subunit